MAEGLSVRARVQRLGGDISAAITGSLMTLPTSIGYGLITFSPLGPNAVAGGLVAVLVAVVLGGAIVGVGGSTSGLAVGGSSSVALLLAGLVGAELGHGGNGDPVAFALALVMATTVLTALLLGILAWLGAGRLAQLMPYPVVAGIVNGTAVLMVIGMARHAAGFSPGGYDDDWDPGAVLVAATVIAVMLASMPRRIRAIPKVLLAVLAGTAVHHGLLPLTDEGFVGPLLGALPSVNVAASNWLGAVRSLYLITPWMLLLQVLPVAASIAVLAMLETLASASALQDATARQGDSRGDLQATAVAALASGLAGGIAPAGSLSSSMGMLRAGAATRLALPLRSLVLVACYLFLGQEIGQVPMAALAGVVIAGGIGLLDLAALRPAWLALHSKAQHRGDIIGSALVVLAVTGIAVRWSLLTAVAMGMLLAVMVFAASMARDVVRRVYSNPTGRSRIRRPEGEIALLIAEGRRIVVVELEGAIFFGSVDRITNRVQQAMAAGARYVILDMRRVSRIDHSGARRLLHSCNQFWRQGQHLSLAYVRPGLAVWDYLNELGLMPQLQQQHVFASLDAAVEVAEVRLLQDQDAPPQQALSPEEGLRSLRIPDAIIPGLLAHMERMSFPAGDLVIRAGDNATDVWLLLSGLLDVTLPLAGANKLRTRLATLTPGALAGEMALLSGQPRSADVLARTDVDCLRFEVATMERLRQEAPDLAYHLLAGISLQVQQNLRQANMTIGSLEE
jgi:MFS superfamily sulfate permease-like transporter/CRP-like cAMP-binding protein